MCKVLVTGATRGPGRAIAAGLATAGYETCALGRDRVVLEELRGDFGVLPMALDLTDREAVKLIVDGMSPDVIVHAALRWPTHGGFQELDEADVDMALEVNLSATLHLTRSALPSMKARGEGGIFIVTSGSGTAATLLERTVDGANAAFVEALRGEVAGHGIVVSRFPAGEPPFDSVVQSILSALREAGRAPVIAKDMIHVHGQGN